MYVNMGRIFQQTALRFADHPAVINVERERRFTYARMHELTGDGSQFIIATHSPILMAYPNADILLMTEDGPQPVDYTNTEHYRVTRDFLMNHEKMLRILMEQ